MPRKPAAGGIGSNQYVTQPGHPRPHLGSPAAVVRGVQQELDPEEVAWVFSPESEDWKRLGVESYAEAQGWQDSPFSWDDTIRWRQAGCDLEQATRWHAANCPPSLASQWIAGGWTVEQAERFADAGVQEHSNVFRWLTLAGGDREQAIVLAEARDTTLIGSGGIDDPPPQEDWTKVAKKYKNFTGREMAESGLGVPAVGWAIRNGVDLQELARRWRDAGFDNAVRWSACFHDLEVAAEWAFHPDIASAYNRSNVARMWSASGFTASEAVLWADHHFAPSSAYHWRRVTPDPVRARYLADRQPTPAPDGR